MAANVVYRSAIMCPFCKDMLTSRNALDIVDYLACVPLLMKFKH